jgi:hypothetical protein
LTTPLPRRVTPVPEVLFQDVGDEAVLLNLQTEHYFSLNDVGARIWELLCEHGDTATVLALLLDAYDTDVDTLRQDLAQLITELHEAALVMIEE